MTLESKDIIKIMLENNGIYPGDPQMSSIWKYNHISNDKELYAIFDDERWNDIYLSPYVKNPILLWDQANGLTEEGKLCLK